MIHMLIVSKEAQTLLDHYKQILSLHNKISTLGESDK